MIANSLEALRQIAIPLFEQYHVKLASVFGSFARNEQGPDSDIDLLVDFAGKYDLWDVVGLKQDLEAALERKVDLLTVNSLMDEEFDRTILREGKVIYG